MSDSCHRETSLGYHISLLSFSYKLTRVSNFFTMRQHIDAPISGTAQSYHIQYYLELQCHHQRDSAVLSPAWLDIYITPRPSRPGSIVDSMTRQHSRQHDWESTTRRGQVTQQHQCQYDTAALWPAWLDIYIVQWPSRPVAPSPAWLDSIVASMIRHLHHATTMLPR
jgi:hypothetical protein